MATSTRILVVDDDHESLRMLSSILIDAEHSVMAVCSGSDAIDAVRQGAFDVMILDILMPEVDGIQVCEEVRKFSEIPIIILSAVFDEARVIRALEAGADEYLVKPFRTGELRARIAAVLRRTRQFEADPPHAEFSDGNLCVNEATAQVTVGGQRVRLTPTEFALLRCLIRTPDRMIPHDRLLSCVWGREYHRDSHLLHINISRLRAKLGGLVGPAIVTYNSTGYLFRTTAAAEPADLGAGLDHPPAS